MLAEIVFVLEDKVGRKCGVDMSSESGRGLDVG